MTLPTTCYMSLKGQCAARLNESNRAKPMPTDQKENSIFYLKLQWIAAKDDAERKALGDRIRRLLASKPEPSE